jgi:zinc protease
MRHASCMFSVLTAACTALPAAALPAAVADAAFFADTSTTAYDVGGVRVIHRQIAANELVAVNLYLLGGSAVLTADNAGVEALLLRASEFGTTSYPGRDARLALARTGSRVFVDAGADWTVYGFRGIRTEFDSTWNVFADRLMHPTLESATVELVRSRMLRDVRSRTSHPDSRVAMLADSVAFAGHAYARSPSGTEHSLTGLTPDALREFAGTHMVTSRMLLVVVGNVSRQQVERAVSTTLATLPRGAYTWAPPPSWAAQRATVMAVQQTLPTNYILGYFAGPPANSDDYPAFRVAVGILGGVAGSSIRSQGLSYAAYSPLVERAAAGGGVYVTTIHPDTTMKVFNSTIEWMQDATVQRSVLQRYLSGFITEYYAENESLGGQAAFLARHELLRGGWQQSADFMQEMRSIQGHHIRAAARQYMRNIQYVFLGDANRAPTAVMTRY